MARKSQKNKSTFFTGLFGKWHMMEVFLWEQRRGNNVILKEFIMINVSVMSTRGSNNNLLLVKPCPVFQCEHVTICFCREGTSGERGYCCSNPVTAPHSVKHVIRLSQACVSLPPLPLDLSLWTHWELDSLPILRLHSWSILLLPAPLWAK